SGWGAGQPAGGGQRDTGHHRAGHPDRQPAGGAVAPGDLGAGAPAAPAGAGRAQGATRRKALRFWRGARVPRRARPPASPAAQTGTGRRHRQGAHGARRRLSADGGALMRWLRSGSLQAQLATRLAALFLLTTIILVAAFLYLSYDLAESLSRSDLFDISEELAEEIEDDGQLDSEEELIARGWLRENTLYAIFDNRGRVLVASDSEFSEAISA